MVDLKKMEKLLKVLPRVFLKLTNKIDYIT